MYTAQQLRAQQYGENYFTVGSTTYQLSDLGTHYFTSYVLVQTSLK